jgi:hypothetical protein
MADSNRGPAPYINTVPEEGKDPFVKTVAFDENPIGANAAGKPKALRSNGMALQHYGTSTNGNGG